MQRTLNLAAALCALVALATPSAALGQDFVTGAITQMVVGNSSSADTGNPQVTGGEVVNVLATVTFDEGATAAIPVFLAGDILLTVPAGLTFRSTFISSKGRPVDITSYGTVTDQSGGAGTLLSISLGVVFNPTDTASPNTRNDFAVFGFQFACQDGPATDMPVALDLREVGQSRGAASVTVERVKAALKVTREISPTTDIELSTPMTVTVTVEYSGAGPHVNQLTVLDETSFFDAESVTAITVPTGYRLSGQSGIIRLDPTGDGRLGSQESIQLTYRVKLRAKKAVPLSAGTTTRVTANTHPSPFPAGFTGVVAAVSDPVTIATLDADQDGLTNAQEADAGTSSTDADCDDDGVMDGDEPDALEDMDGDGKIGALDPDSDNDRILDGTELGATAGVAAGAGFAGTDTSSKNFKVDADPTTTTLANSADSDGDGSPDGAEDKDRNGRKDARETNPLAGGDVTATARTAADSDADGVPDVFEDANGNGQVDTGETDPAVSDAGSSIDTDADGIPDNVERRLGLDPDVADLDSDDDGIPDLDEPGGFLDVDGDGLVGALDRDSDDDGVPDGVEFGLAAPLGGGTDLARFVADLDPTTTTSVIDPDTDGDGLRDGFEDLDGNGRVDAGETDPRNPTDSASIPGNLVDSDSDGLPDEVELAKGLDPLLADTDDDGIADGQEPGGLSDADGDGRIGAKDPDSNDDGILDGTVFGVTEGVSDPDGSGAAKGTDTRSLSFVVDADPTTTGNPLTLDSDEDGTPDAFEDLNGNGRVDDGETDPFDETDMRDSDGDGRPDRAEDLDGDGIVDPGETDPDDPSDGADTDRDGVPDAVEDTDGDGVVDPGEGDPNDGTDQPDSDGDGVPDRQEDPNGNGTVDEGESDPANPLDGNKAIANIRDTAGDGIPDVLKRARRVSITRLDPDNDGVATGDETAPFADSDGDGLLNCLDADSDNDGILDGVEKGITAGVDDPDGAGSLSGTDTTAITFATAAQPASPTSMVNPDTDGDGLPDGFEDLDRNGRLDAGETSPSSATSVATLTDTNGDGFPDVVATANGMDPLDRDNDDDGAADGDERSPLADVDWDGIINARDPDADNDGLPDGLEMGFSTAVPGGVTGTAAGASTFRPDLDPSSTTDPLRADTDGDGKADGTEDLDANGRVDLGETDPAAADSGFPVSVVAKGGGCQVGTGGEAGPTWALLGALAALGLGARRRRRIGARRALTGGVGGCATLALLASAALAEPLERGFNARHFRPNADGLGILTLESPDVLPSLTPYAALYYDHADNSGKLGTADGGYFATLVEGMDAFTAALALGLPFDLELAATVPLVIYLDAYQPDNPSRDRHGGGFGDIRASLKWRAIESPDGRFAMAFQGHAVTPTGQTRRFRGDDVWTAGGAVLAEGRLWDRVRVGASLGYEWLDGDLRFQGVKLDDRVRYGVGAAVMVFSQPALKKKLDGAKPVWRLDLEAALDGSVRAGKPSEERSAPLEVYGGVKLDTPLGLSVSVGPSFGLTDGLGVAEWRVFLGVAFTLGTPPRAAWLFDTRD